MTRRFRVTRPIPLLDDAGRQVRLAKPGSTGELVEDYDGSYPGEPNRRRAVVRFDDDPATYDVSRDSIWVDEP